MKKSLYLALFLAWICIISGGLLALANAKTAPIIAANKAAAEAASFNALFGEGTTYTPVEVDQATYPAIQQAFRTDKGILAYKCSVYGFQSDIVFIVGVDTDGTIMGYTCLENGDTPGYGLKAADPEYADMLIGNPISEDVDVIAGASTTTGKIRDVLKQQVGAHYASNK